MEVAIMSALEPDAKEDSSVPLPTEKDAESTRVNPAVSQGFEESSRSSIQDWKIRCSKLLLEIFISIRPIIKETVSFAVFMLADYLIVQLAGLLFSHIINKYSFLGYFYDGIEIASFTVIIVHFIGNCILEMNKDKNNVLAEILSKKAQ